MSIDLTLLRLRCNFLVFVLRLLTAVDIEATCAPHISLTTCFILANAMLSVVRSSVVEFLRVATIDLGFA